MVFPWFSYRIPQRASFRCLPIVPSSQRHLRRLRSVHDETTASLDQPAGIDWPFISVISPICSMYGIFTNIGPKNGSNVGKYSIHGASGSGYNWDYKYLELVISDYNWFLVVITGVIMDYTS